MEQRAGQTLTAERTDRHSSLAEADQAVGYRWNQQRVKQLLRAPATLLRDEGWRSWLQQHGGIEGVYTYLRGLPLHTEEQALLKLILTQPGEPVSTYMRLLHIGRSTYFRRLQDLLDLLVEYLNAWDVDLHNDLGRPEDQPSVLSPATWEVRHTLPAETTSFVARSEECAAIRQLLQQQMVRIITLTGTGGTGKTRLALRVAHELQALFAHGALFISLASIDDPALVISTIAQALEVKETSGRSHWKALTSYLYDREILLVLDNFEHVIQARKEIAELVTETSAVKIIVTSRFPLHIYGEYEMRISPLPLPDVTAPSLEAFAAMPAIRLFCDRARAADWQFTLTDENVSAVVEICHRLDGLPLAIELAATQMKWFSAHALCTHLFSRLSALGDSPLDMPARQRTLRNTIEWSYNLLRPIEQRIFTRLSIFAGSFTCEEVLSICNLEDMPETAIETIIRALHEKSMLRLERLEATAGDQAAHLQRLSLLETLREFAHEHLVASGELYTLQSRHAEYYLALAQSAEPNLLGRNYAQWIRRLEHTINNLRAALQWLLSEPPSDRALRLSAALLRFWLGQGLLNEGRRWVEAALQRHAGASNAVLANAYRVAGILAWVQTDFQPAIHYQEVSLSLGHTMGDIAWVGRALNNLSVIEIDLGNLARAAALLNEGLAYAQRSTNPVLPAFLLHNLGQVAMYEGEYQRASELMEKSLSLARMHDRTFLVTGNLTWLGHIRLYQGNYKEAQNFFEEALLLRLALPDREGIPWSLEAIALLAEVQGALSRAAQLWGAAEEFRKLFGVPLPPVEQARIERIRSALDRKATNAEWMAAWEKGRTMTLDQAVAYALQRNVIEGHIPHSKAITTPSASSPTQRPMYLTAREQEIMELLVQGLTNREIAQRLAISPRTVSVHLRRLFCKTHTRTRAGLVGWAGHSGNLSR